MNAVIYEFLCHMKAVDRAERDELPFTIYAFTGIRRTEALALKRSDFDAPTRNLSIHSLIVRYSPNAFDSNACRRV